MVSNILYFLGLVLVILGVLSLTGVFVVGSASAVTLLVVGFLVLLGAYFFTGGTYTRTGRR